MSTQDFLVIVFVVAAIAYLGWHFWRRHQRKTGCASCKLMQAAQRFPENDRRPANKLH